MGTWTAWRMATELDRHGVEWAVDSAGRVWAVERGVIVDSAGEATPYAASVLLPTRRSAVMAWLGY